MKMVITTLALVAIMASCSYADDAAAQDIQAVVQRYSEIADLTTVETRQVKVALGERSVDSQASYSYKGRVPDRPAHVTYRLWTVNPKPVWIEAEDVIYFEFGDNIARVPAELRMVVKESAAGKEVTETLTARIATGIFETISAEEEITIVLTGDNRTPRKSTLREKYPLDAANFAPFKELSRSISLRK